MDDDSAKIQRWEAKIKKLEEEIAVLQDQEQTDKTATQIAKKQEKIQDTLPVLERFRKAKTRTARKQGPLSPGASPSASAFLQSFPRFSRQSTPTVEDVLAAAAAAAPVSPGTNFSQLQRFGILHNPDLPPLDHDMPPPPPEGLMQRQGGGGYGRHARKKGTKRRKYNGKKRTKKGGHKSAKQESVEDEGNRRRIKTRRRN